MFLLLCITIDHLLLSFSSLSNLSPHSGHILAASVLYQAGDDNQIREYHRKILQIENQHRCFKHRACTLSKTAGMRQAGAPLAFPPQVLCCSPNSSENGLDTVSRGFACRTVNLSSE